MLASGPHGTAGLGPFSGSLGSEAGGTAELSARPRWSPDSRGGVSAAPPQPRPAPGSGWPLMDGNETRGV